MLKKLFLLSVFIQFSIGASAYNLYKTPSGSNVRWDVAEVEFVLDPGLATLGTMDTVEATIENAFLLWQETAEVPIHFTVTRGNCRTLEADSNNCIFACSNVAECPRDEKDKGAGTFLSVSAETGAIQDVDIVFNAVDWQWESDEPKPQALNLNNVIVHEIGHALGIDHSTVEEAAMFATIRTSERSRSTLHEDDISAAQALYEGFTPKTEMTYGCTVAAPGSPPKLSYCMGIIALSAILLIRRVRKETL